MKVTRLQVENFEGLTQLEVSPTNINMVEGHNGAGKTSVLEAIRVAFSNKGTRSKLVRDGKACGTILFELSDGTSGERRVDEGGRTAGPVILYDARGVPISKAQKFLNSLGLGFGFNPLDFIDLRPDQQTKRLLEVTTIDCGIGQLISLTRRKVEGVDYRKHPLKVLKDIEAALMEERRMVGRDKRDTEGMVEKLRAKVPQSFHREDAEAFDLAGAYQRLNEIEQAKQKVTRLENRCTQIENKIESLEERLAELRKDLMLASSDFDAAQEVVEQFSTTEEDELRAGIVTYEENQQHLNNLRQADEREAQVSELTHTYTELSDQIEAVRAKPAELLEQSGLPVEGLGISEDGNVTINGLPISELSTGEQLKVAVDIAVATLGELKVVLVDGLERLDEANQNTLLKRLAEAGVQAFVAKVTDTELTVITDYNPNAEVGSGEIPF